MSYYEGGGYLWKAGEVPMCTACGERVAVRTTAHLGVHLCDDPECHTWFVMQVCDEIEFVEDSNEEEPEP